MGTAVYYRFTTERRAANEAVLQQADVINYCRQHSLSIDMVFQDIGYQPNTYFGRRSEAILLLKACEAGEIDTVVFYDSESLAGGLTYRRHALALLLEENVSLHFVNPSHDIVDQVVKIRADLTAHVQQAHAQTRSDLHTPAEFFIDFCGETGSGDRTFMEAPHSIDLARVLRRHPTREEFNQYVLSVSQEAHTLEQHSLYVQWLACVSLCNDAVFIHGGMWPGVETGRPRLYLQILFEGSPDETGLWKEVQHFTQQFDGKLDSSEVEGFEPGETRKEAKVEWQVYGWRVYEVDDFIESVFDAIEENGVLREGWLQIDLGLDDEHVEDGESVEE